ncbi:MAG: metallophosphoesterase family protein [Burkholderiales bacterium]
MQPGRSCPLHYRYAPQSLRRPPEILADTLYVIGGLYGNLPALQAVSALAAAEPEPVALVFNGDFNWFNIDGGGFSAINETVLQHHALRGNVETELAGDDDEAGCGCAYPDSVGDEEVARSNAMLAQLRATARRFPDLRSQLAALPMNRVAEVGGLRIAIVHGDCESLAGWSYDESAFRGTTGSTRLAAHFAASGARIIASSHTCLPVALRQRRPQGDCALFNNGAAGMPNFAGTQFGVITRIATTPARPSAALYGTVIHGVHIDALAVHYDSAQWQQDFAANWPAGSAGYLSYHRRITQGPRHGINKALHKGIHLNPELLRGLRASEAIQ